MGSNPAMPVKKGGIMKIKKLFRELKNKRQRAKKGYADSDLWNLDYWFLDIMPRMLKQFRDTTDSAPVFSIPGATIDNCHEKWREILDRMIFLLEEMDEYKCSYKNPYQEEFEELIESEDLTQTIMDSFMDKYNGEEINKAKHMELCKEEFFYLFSKYFYDLWN